MARWKLTEAHYIKVEGTTWEYNEIDRTTGRPKRTKFPVPMLLDPASADDLKQYGQDDPFLGRDADPVIIVIQSEDYRKHSRDVSADFTPTPGMMPLDDEAKAITAELSKGAWVPTNGIDPESQNNSYTAKLLNGMIDRMTDMKTGVQQAPQVQGIEELLKTMSAVMAQQTEILGAIAKQGVRR